MSPSWGDNGLSEEFYILVTVPLAGMTSPKRDDTEHLRIDPCAGRAGRRPGWSGASCPPWPDLILTFPKLLSEPTALGPRGWERRLGKASPALQELGQP